MSTSVWSRARENKLWAVGGGGLFLALAAISVANLHRSSSPLERIRAYEVHEQAYSQADSLAKPQASVSTALVADAPAPPPPPPGLERDSLADRKIVRSSSLEMTVASPSEAAEKIRAVTMSLGGYIENSEINTQDAPTATLTIRVPAAKLDEAKAELRGLAVRVDSEKTDAQDVTKQYVDMDARLRNLRAEEAQYLTIMKSATKVQDMLDVSEKLSSVRGEIEQQQAEFATLSKQVETVAVTILLRAQVETDVLGFHWRPLYQLKLAAHDALEGLANYATTMMAVILYLPVILLWAVTIFFGGFVGWRVIRWVGRVLFGWKPSVPALQ